MATRLIEDLTGNWGMRLSDIIVDTPDLPHRHRPGGDPPGRDRDHRGDRELKRRYPDVQTTLGLSNVSFGLNPAARPVLNSVFLAECVQAGLDSAIVHAAKILPVARIPDEQRRSPWTWSTTGAAAAGYDPLSRFLDLFEGVDTAAVKESRAEELAALPLCERLERRIIDGERNGLEADLDEG